MNRFECKIRYEKQITDPNDRDCGKLKRVTETYLVDAVNCTEAEARIEREVVAQYIKGEYQITRISKANIAELIYRSDDVCESWFKVTVKVVIIDEERGEERQVPQNVLVRADGVETAMSRFKEAFRDSMCDYTITGVVTSPILEYFVEKEDSHV